MWSTTSAHQKQAYIRRTKRYIMLVPVSIYDLRWEFKEKGVGSIRGRRLGILVLWGRYDMVLIRYFT
jgi:hypothetical protein